MIKFLSSYEWMSFHSSSLDPEECFSPLLIWMVSLSWKLLQSAYDWPSAQLWRKCQIHISVCVYFFFTRKRKGLIRWNLFKHMTICPSPDLPHWESLHFTLQQETGLLAVSLSLSNVGMEENQLKLCNVFSGRNNLREYRERWSTELELTENEYYHPRVCSWIHISTTE